MQTPHLHLPLPRPEARLSEDVHRLRQALISLDSIISELRGAVETEISLQLAELQEDVQKQLATLKTNIYIPLPDVAGPQPGESSFRLPGAAQHGAGADVAGLGRFIWDAQATDPVDSETCLLAEGQADSAPGRWLLVQPSWAAILSETMRWLDDLRYRLDQLSLPGRLRVITGALDVVEHSGLQSLVGIVKSEAVSPDVMIAGVAREPSVPGVQFWGEAMHGGVKVWMSGLECTLPPARYRIMIMTEE